MVAKKAVSSGLWSSTGTWDGGTLPGNTDDVYANNFVVSIDQTITVNSLKTISGSGITAGGSFKVTAAATVNITAGIAAADNVTDSTYLLAIDTGSHAVTINSNLTGGAGSARVALATLSGYTGALTINGNLVGGASSNARVVDNNGAPTSVTITGNVTGGSASTTGIDCWGNTGGGTIGTLTINGNLLGGSNSGNALEPAGAAVVNITGNVTGGASGARGINANAFSPLDITITGDVAGGSANTAYGINLNSGAVTVRGNIRPGSYSFGCPAILSTNVGSISLRVSGDIWAGGVSGTAGPDGWFPITGTWTVIDGESLDLNVFDDSDYPNGMDGTPTIVGGSGGGTAPTSGVGWPPRYYL